jgi:DNA-directed RNA polymerase subunit RPC12/RpoP
MLIMKFQCGQCGQYHLIEDAEQISGKQTLRCTTCGNLFFLQKGLSFSSSSRNSKMVCGRCGSLFKEGSDCADCNPALNKLREEFLIDNKDYNFFSVRRGRIRPKRDRRGNRTILLVGTAVLTLAVATFFLLSAKKRDELHRTVLKPLGIGERTETQVVIMRSGRTYYAMKIEREGPFLKIVDRDGLVVTAEEKDVLQIAKAVVEE